jgi:elongation factor G
MGFVEPLPEDSESKYIFENQVIGNAISPGYINACEKGFNDIVKKGPQIGAPVWGIKVVVNDGVTHSVDSSELAFKTGNLNK